MNDVIDLLTRQLHEHQRTRPETPTDRHPAWCQDQFERWQREDQALRLLLGAQLVERELANKDRDAPIWFALAFRDDGPWGTKLGGDPA